MQKSCTILRDEHTATAMSVLEVFQVPAAQRVQKACDASSTGRTAHHRNLERVADVGGALELVQSLTNHFRFTADQLIALLDDLPADCSDAAKCVHTQMLSREAAGI